MREHEERAAQVLRDDRARIAAGARELRRLGSQGGYAGMRGEYTAYGMASLLDAVQVGLDVVPELVRREALAVASMVLDGPDGGHDARARGAASRFKDGPGH